MGVEVIDLNEDEYLLTGQINVYHRATQPRYINILFTGDSMALLAKKLWN